MSEKSKDDNRFVTLICIRYTDQESGTVFFRFGQWSREEVEEEFKERLESTQWPSVLHNIRHVEVYRHGGRTLLYRFRSLLEKQAGQLLEDILNALESKRATLVTGVREMKEPPRENMVLRTFYLDREVDNLLRRQAASRDISKGERIRQLIACGLAVEAQTLDSPHKK